MSLNTSTLRPGLLVVIKTSIKGNVSYSKQDLGFLELGDGASKAKWETERFVKNEAEQKKAAEIRSKARSLIASVCSSTDFGYLCPQTAKPDLEKAVAEARRICEEFNETATVTSLKFNYFTGVVAQDDVQAIKAINEEVRGLLEDMKAGLDALDVEKVRAAANKAKQIGQMLTPDAEVRLQLAIDAAREQARKIVKAGESAAIEIDRNAIVRLQEARTAFLDIESDAKDVQAPEATGARALDFVPEEGSAQIAAPEARAREIELS
jgi:hypothetical protein